MDNILRMTVRLPRWAVIFLDEHCKENMTSRNAEIIRTIKYAKEKGVTEAATSSRHVEQSQLTNGDRYDR